MKRTAETCRVQVDRSHYDRDAHVVMHGLLRRSSRCCLQYATRAEAVAAIEAARWLGHGRGLWVRPARRLA